MDDHSHYILYAVLVRKESSWAHIQELQSTILKYGCPFSYYVDCHSIFRYVRGRDQLHNRFTKFTDDVDPQWKQVLKNCNIKPIYTLSPQAKGKIERPFGWIQDHLVRYCVCENVKDIFCLRLNRFVDNHHSVTVNKARFKLTDVEPKYPVNIRIHILSDQLSEFRFWYNGKLINKKRVKNDEFLPVHF